MATSKFAVTGEQFMIIDDRMREIKRQLRQEAGSPLDPELLGGVLQQIIEGNFGPKKFLGDTYTVIVKRNKDVKEMIKAGRYAWANPDITGKNFKVEGSGRVDVKLLHYGRDMSTYAVLKDMEQRGYSPAKIEELLALACAQRNLQREFPIIALGSVWQDPDDDRYCPCLAYGSERRLDLALIDSDFEGICRFAAVSKINPAL